MQTAEDVYLSKNESLPLLSSLAVEDADLSDVAVGSKQLHAPQLYQPDEEQLLVEGQGGIRRQLDAQARLQKVVFGQISGRPACLILLSVDFTKGAYLRETDRFISADVTAEFSPVVDSPIRGTVAVNDFYPRVSRGYIQTRSSTTEYHLSFPNTALGGGGPSYTHSSSNPGIESQHIIHGLRKGKSGNRILWLLRENANTRSGLCLNITLAVTVTYSAGQEFQVTADIKATTSLLTPISKKSLYPIILRPGETATSGMDNLLVHRTLIVEAGSLSASGKIWVPSRESLALADLKLTVDQFEALTGVSRAILAPQGPGAGPAKAIEIKSSEEQKKEGSEAE
jgi:hypothetical protein